MTTQHNSDRMDWQFESIRLSRPRGQLPLPSIPRRTTTIDDFHPPVERAFFPPGPGPTPHQSIQLSNRMNRVPNSNSSTSPINYTIFNEEQRRSRPPIGPSAVPIGSARFLHRVPRPQQPPSPLRSMNTAETLQTHENPSEFLQTARRIIQEHRQRVPQTDPEVQRRIARLNARRDRRTTVVSRRRSPNGPARFGTLPGGLQGNFFHHNFTNPRPAGPRGPTGLPQFPSINTLPVDAQNNSRPILPLPARAQRRSSPGLSVQGLSQPQPSSPAFPSTRPSLPTPPPVLRKRYLEEIQDEETPDSNTGAPEEEVKEPTQTTESDNSDNEVIMAGSPESEDQLNQSSEGIIMSLDIPGAWPASFGSSLTGGNRTMPGERTIQQKLQDVVARITYPFRNAHTLIRQFRAGSYSLRRRGQRSVHHVTHVVRGAFQMAGSVKRRAIELCSSRTPALSEPIDLAKERKSPRPRTPEERHRWKADKLRKERGSRPSSPVSPYSPSQTEHSVALSPVEDKHTSPSSPTASTTHYSGPGRDLTPTRPNKTNRPPERKRSSPVYNTDDKSPSRARKQRYQRNSPPNLEKLQLTEEVNNATAIPAPTSPVQSDIASPSIVEPPSSPSFDVFNPWSQQHYAEYPHDPDQQPDYLTEEELPIVPEELLAIAPATPEPAYSANDLPVEGLFLKTDKAVKEEKKEDEKEKEKKGAVRWADGESPRRPISEIRLYDPSSRIDSPLHTRERQVRGGRVKGETRRPPAPPKRIFVKALPPKWEKKVDEAMGLPNSHKLGTTIGGDPLTRRDLATCYQPLAWLNDEVINAYLAIIIDFLRRTSDASSNEQPRHHAFNSFFFSNLRDKGYSSVRRWATRAKIGKENLLGVEIVLVPIHHHSHWTLCVVRPAARTIEHFDSLGGMSRAHVALIKNWLQQELGDKYVEEEWTVLPSRSPQQDNGSDCGVFLLTTAKLRALNLDPLSYGAKDIPLIRKRIVGELMNGGFEGKDLNPVEGKSRL